MGQVASTADVDGHMFHSHGLPLEGHLGEKTMETDRQDEDAPRQIRQNAALFDPLESLGGQDEASQKIATGHFDRSAAVTLHSLEGARAKY